MSIIKCNVTYKDLPVFMTANSFYDVIWFVLIMEHYIPHYGCRTIPV